MEKNETHPHGWQQVLAVISEEARKQDVLDALTFSNHKGASTKPDLLQKLVGKDT